MKCTEIKNLLSPYLEGDLDEKTKQFLDSHLLTCASCAKELEGLKETIAGLKKIPEVEPPPYFLEAVHARLERPSLLDRVLRRLFVPVYIKVPVEVVTVTATAIIIVVLVQKTGMLRVGRLGAPAEVQYAPEEIYSEQRVTDRKEAVSKLAQPQMPDTKQYKFPEMHPREMASQAAGADWQRMSQAQYGLKTAESIPVIKPGEGTALGKTKEMILDKDTVALEGKYRGLDLVRKEEGEKAYVEKLAMREPVIAENQIILKTQELEQDRTKIEVILRDLHITNIKIESYPDKVLFNFSILYNQLETLESKLKDWQILSLPTEKLAKEEASLEPILVELILTTQ